MARHPLRNLVQDSRRYATQVVYDDGESPTGLVIAYASGSSRAR